MIPRGPRNTKTNKSQALPFWNGTEPGLAGVPPSCPTPPCCLSPSTSYRLYLGSSHLNPSLFVQILHLRMLSLKWATAPATHTHTHIVIQSHTFLHMHTLIHNHTNCYTPTHTHTSPWPCLPHYSGFSLNVPSFGRPSLTVLIPTPD